MKNDSTARCILKLPEPLGRVAAEIGSRGLTRLHLRVPQGFREHRPAHLRANIELVRKTLAAYCKTGRVAERPPLAMSGTPFQRAVWKTLAATRPGQTLSYRQLAAKAGYPNASRAVGTAMANNPLPVFVPCHRVVRSDGSLGNFGGGVSMKHALLALEGCDVTARGVAQA